MEQRIKTMIKVTLLIIVAVWFIDKISFNKNIDQQITANLYKNDAVIGQTAVIIKGEKSRYLFRKSQQYWGKFQINCYEKTLQESINAGIDWNSDNNIQSIRYMTPGAFPDMEIMYYMLINEEMTEFVLMFSDGTVLATSDELYQLYIQHFSVNHAGGMSVEDVTGIPKIR